MERTLSNVHIQPKSTDTRHYTAAEIGVTG